jgi:NADH-quinone oxidoreductase B subunit
MNLVKWSRIKSPWVFHFNAGGCNGCDIEILACLMPRYDIERFGMILRGSPRHADVMLVTGTVTRQIYPRLRRIYDQIPDPKFTLALGSCACSGGVFQQCYNVHEGADKAIPVDVYVPGCPPRPQAIIDGAVKLLQKISKS